MTFKKLQFQACNFLLLSGHHLSTFLAFLRFVCRRRRFPRNVYRNVCRCSPSRSRTRRFFDVNCESSPYLIIRLLDYTAEEKHETQIGSCAHQFEVRGIVLPGERETLTAPGTLKRCVLGRCSIFHSFDKLLSPGWQLSTRTRVLCVHSCRRLTINMFPAIYSPEPEQSSPTRSLRPMSCQL